MIKKSISVLMLLFFLFQSVSAFAASETQTGNGDIYLESEFTKSDNAQHARTDNNYENASRNEEITSSQPVTNKPSNFLAASFPAGSSYLDCTKTYMLLVCNWSASLYSDKIIYSNVYLTYYTSFGSPIETDYFNYPVYGIPQTIYNQGSFNAPSPGYYTVKLAGSVSGFTGSYTLSPKQFTFYLSN